MVARIMTVAFQGDLALPAPAEGTAEAAARVAEARGLAAERAAQAPRC
jgi:hypothetical protein